MTYIYLDSEACCVLVQRCRPYETSTWNAL